MTTDDVSLAFEPSRTSVNTHRSCPRLVSLSEKDEKAVGVATKGQLSAAKLNEFFVSVRNISAELNPVTLAENVIDESCKLLEAERATLFYVDGDELVLMIAKGAKSIRLPITKGIAGYVATTGDVANIPDPLKDERFDSSHDKKTNFVTRNILAAPVVDKDGNIIAVLQIINKLEGAFSDTDNVIIQNLAAHVSTSLINAHKFEASKRTQTKIAALLELIQLMHQSSNINSIMFSLSARAHQLVDADRCTLYLADRTLNQLIMLQGNLDIRIPMGKGLAGFVATSGHIVNIPDCYVDPRFNQDIDKKTGYRTRSMLCMPICAPAKDADSSNTTKTSKKIVIGVLQVINRLDDMPFSDADQQLLGTLLDIAGPILQKHKLFKRGQAKEQTTEAQRAFGSYAGHKKKKTFKKSSFTPTFTISDSSASALPRATQDRRRSSTKRLSLVEEHL